MSDDAYSSRKGFFYALGAYGLWGFLPLYFRLLDHVPAAEMIAHRILWSVPIALLVIGFQHRLGELKSLFSDKRIFSMMAITAVLISLNWGIYVWAISVDRTAEAALGYYINPLLTVVLGFALLGEKLTRLQWAAVAIALAAVVLRTVAGGVFPWIAVSLAVLFAAYGYFRKTVAVGPTQGFLMEVVILSPFALAYIGWLVFQGESHFTFANTDGGWMMFAGVVTAVPLIFYAYGAKLLRLTTLGLMQYIAPSMIFLIAIFVFKESMDFWQSVTFAMIWFALALYTWSLFKRG
ncbi:MAG: EamA family transporter RarD [Rhizobiaceae bacterium]